MHPDVRATEPGKCPQCGMQLVAMPEAHSDYWLDVETEPRAVPVARPVRMRLAVRERPGNAVATRFEPVHERPMHLFLVSHDLTHFEHVHPTPEGDGTFTVTVTLPKAGPYRLVADVLPIGAAPLTLQHSLVTARHLAPLARSRATLTVETTEARDGDVIARMQPMPLRAGEDAHVAVEFVDSGTHQPVRDLDEYLGAWGHMLLASGDLQDIVHSHPLVEETEAGGPRVTFQTLFAREGWYRVWTQVQRRGRLLTFRFTVRVASAT